jgi:hypothetical protein
MSTNVKFTYTIQDENTLFADNIESRDSARNRLREVKALGHNQAKIIREEYFLLSQKQVR